MVVMEFPKKIKLFKSLTGEVYDGWVYADKPREWLEESQEYVNKQEFERLQSQIYEWENRESKICPEDVGFEEHVSILEKRIIKLKEQLVDYKVLVSRHKRLKVAGERLDKAVFDFAHYDGGDSDVGGEIEQELEDASNNWTGVVKTTCK